MYQDAGVPIATPRVRVGMSTVCLSGTNGYGWYLYVLAGMFHGVVHMTRPRKVSYKGSLTPV